MAGPRRCVDPAQIAAKFRYYAELCRAFAESRSEHAADLLAQAERWEADARMLELDARLIKRSKELIAQVEHLVPSRPPKLVGAAPNSIPGFPDADFRVP
jgi:hypothetical protein